MKPLIQALQEKYQARSGRSGRTVALCLSLSLSLAVATALGGCSDGSDSSDADDAVTAPNTPPTDSGPATDTPAAGASRALIVGLDGVTYNAIQAGLANGTLPNFAKLKVSVAYSGGMPGGQTQQANLHTPGWATLLSGNWANLHQVTSDASGLAIQGGSVFEVLKAKGTGLNGAAVASPNIASLLASQHDSSALDTLHDCSNTAAADDCVTEQTLGLIDGAYTTVVAQYHAATDVALGYGTGSSSYANAVRKLDAALGKLLAETAKNPKDKWLVVLTSAYGLGVTGSADGLPLLAESTTFVALNQGLNNAAGVNAVPPATLSALYAYPSIADVTPTVLAYFNATPAAAAYTMYGSQLIGDLAVSQLNVALSTSNFNQPTANATVSWTAPETGAINVLRDGEVIATLPAGTARYVDDGLRDHITSLYPQGGTHTADYVVQAGAGGGLRAIRSAPLSYAPIMPSVSNGLFVYYPMNNTLPPVDAKGNSTLGPFASDLDPATGVVVDGPFGASSHGVQVNLKYTNASNQEGYALTFNGQALDPTNATAPVFSVGFWTRIPRDSCIVGGDYPLVGNKNFKSGANPGFAMAIYGVAAGTGCTLRVNFGDNTNRADSSAAVSNNQWVYAAVTFDGVGKTANWYVYDPILGLRTGSLNGASVDMAKLYTGTNAVPITGKNGYASWGLGTDGTGQYYFNQTDANRPKWNVTTGGTTTATPSRDYDAAFTELAFWNRLLTPAEVTSIYQSQMPLSTVLAH
ncbi:MULTISPECIES: hypothetical protein [unclassified Achromobacter]|uniref:hypothetical protein n=1 Tax=unclassified Achromobacter TaxID=2626865 RepID=UPI000B517831|nr:MULTISPECIES: hypothetical protein [unclassified Achromobacter]OWT69031.1 hypothetical protein CEY05_27660 [Achromobacter sp. HZ34]OWT70436.1 hypothetical protein CEY04_26490 [Achromobacter sp. HZ28]